MNVMVYFGIGFVSSLVGYFGAYALRVRIESRSNADLLEGER